jgi:O-antigen ligase
MFLSVYTTTTGSVSKSSFLNNKKLDKSNIALICILGMVGGFLLSRALLSLSMFLFGINALWNVDPRRWFRDKWWLIGMGWIAVYALTWFWTGDKGNWDTRLQVKLPIMLLPLAFSFIPSFTRKQLQIFTLGVALMLVASAFYSISFLVWKPAYYISQYRQSHILPTLPRQDHIRASITIVLFIAWSVYVWPFLSGKAARWILAVSLGILVVFIHILAAKTGLVSLYLFIICWSIYLAFVKKNKAGIILLAAIPIFVIAGIKYIPTFRERVNYIDFTYYMYKSGDTSGQYGDLARLMSYKLSFRLIQQHPLTGVGTGDMITEMDKAFTQYYPAAPAEARILPHNQFLVVALGCGVPAMLLFAVWVFMPLFRIRKNRQGFFFFTIWLILFIQLLIEPVLEVQFGVFVYLFFLLMQKQELRPDTDRVQQLKGSIRHKIYT